MCLLLIAHQCCTGYPLVVAANRDEFHQRPTAPAAWWDDRANVLGGRDLEAGGTWLACDRRGRFATLTNVRSGQSQASGPRSRGLIINDFLSDTASPAHYNNQLHRTASQYAGFNLLTYGDGQLSWYSNQVGELRLLDPGIYTLSNAALDTAWPKTERLRTEFARLFNDQTDDPVETLLGLLRDGRQADHDNLPDTGIGERMERVLSSIFIEGETYGTRCSTVILIDDAGQLSFTERRYDSNATVSGETRLTFELPASGA